VAGNVNVVITMVRYTDQIKVNIRGKNYKFPLRVNAKNVDHAHDIAERACGGITYRIDVGQKKNRR
jgi:hypothetical protein